jgi:5-methylcytosine-specific restriction endonuclease McrA
MKPIARLQVRLAEILFCAEGVQLSIAKPHATDYWIEQYFPLGLPSDIAKFIHEECKCAHCGAAISNVLERCQCDMPNEDWLHLQVVHSTDVYYSTFKKIIQAESKRIHAMRRKERVAENGGKYSKADVLALYVAQSSMCYFCGDSIAKDGRSTGYHVDHYESLFYGGKNDIANIVLTCMQCNLGKGAVHGDVFERLFRKERSPEVSAKLQVIRRSVRKLVRSLVKERAMLGNENL